MRSRGIAHPFLTSILSERDWSASSPCRFTSGETALGKHYTGGWEGLTAGLNVTEKGKVYCLCQDLNSNSSVV
jgi:hypothetical protein